MKDDKIQGVLRLALLHRDPSERHPRNIPKSRVILNLESIFYLQLETASVEYIKVVYSGGSCVWVLAQQRSAAAKLDVGVNIAIVGAISKLMMTKHTFSISINLYNATREPQPLVQLNSPSKNPINMRITLPRG